MMYRLISDTSHANLGLSGAFHIGMDFKPVNENGLTRSTLGLLGFFFSIFVGELIKAASRMFWTHLNLTVVKFYNCSAVASLVLSRQFHNVGSFVRSWLFHYVASLILSWLFHYVACLVLPWLLHYVASLVLSWLFHYVACLVLSWLFHFVSMNTGGGCNAINYLSILCD